MLAHHFYSNDLTELYRVFKAMPRPFFSQQLVIIPHQNIKHFLMSKLAEDVGVACGLTFITASQAVRMLAELCFGVESIAMSATALAVAVEPLLLEQREAASYLKESPGRGSGLARYIASLFLYYENLAEDPFKDARGHWQERVWRDLHTSGWSSKPEILAKIRQLPPKPLDIHIHVFPVHVLSPIQQALFEHLSKTFPVYFYALSPSKYFWQDLRSKREQAYVEHAELRGYLKVGNSLLASLSKVARSTHLYLEECSHCDGESYVLPEVAKEWTEEHIGDPSLCFEENKAATLLRMLQVDLLFQRNPAETTVPHLESCPSLQVHSHVNKRREVEGVHQCILEFLNATDYTPKDVRVLAPQMSDYEPYIRSLFTLPYRMMDVPERSLEGLLDLIRLLLHPDEITHFFRLINRKQHAFPLSEAVRPALALAAKENPSFSLFCQRLSKSKMFHEEQVWGKNLAIIQHLQTQKTSIEAWRSQFLEMNAIFFPDAEKHIKDFFSFTLAGDVPFSAWGHHWEAHIKSLQTNDSCEDLQRIRCANISSLSEIPSGLTIVLGLSDEHFPCSSSFPTLNLLESKAPKNAHVDRWHFLQVLLSAKERLILSYPRSASGEGCSLILTELLEYLEEVLTKPMTIHHPPLSVVKSQTIQVEAKVPEMTPYRVETLDVRELIEVTKNPLKPYFRHRLGIIFEEKPPSLFPEEHALTLSHLDMAILRRRSMRQDISFQPEGSFHEGSLLRVSLEIQERDMWLRELSICKQDIFRIQLSLGERFNGRTIEGLLPYYCHQGVLCDAKEEFSSFLQLWPQLIILHRICEVPQRVLFLRSQSVRPYCIKDDLASFIEFTELCHREAIPLDPEWIPAILKNDVVSLDKGIKHSLSSFNPVENPYLFSAALPSAEELLKRLHIPVHNAFSGVYKAYYGEDSP